jgi:hypothetical protein
VASTQRAVSVEELDDGVQLDLVHFDADEEEITVIAWAEEGQPDLDYDGLEARPPIDARLATVAPLRS